MLKILLLLKLKCIKYIVSIFIHSWLKIAYKSSVRVCVCMHIQKIYSSTNERGEMMSLCLYHGPSSDLKTS